MKVLIVDDNPLSTELLRQVLRDQYEILVAHNGPDALTLARTELPGLIILDVHMPGMDGFEILKLLKIDPRTAPILVLFVTAFYLESEMMVQGLAMGGFDYITKPFDNDVLLARVGVAARVFEAERQIRELNDQLEQRVAERTAQLEASNQALRQSESKFSQAFRASPNAVTLSRLDDGTLLEINDGFTRLTGYTAVEAIGHTAHALHLWVNPEDAVAVGKALADGASVQEQECRFRTKDGVVLTGLVSAEPTEVDGHPCAVAVVRDITDRKQAEIQRELLGTLAHELTGVVTPEALGQVMAEYVHKLLQSDAFLLAFYDPATDTHTPFYAEDTPSGGTAPLPVAVGPRSESPPLMRKGAQLERLLLNREQVEDAQLLTAWGYASRRSWSLLFAPIRKDAECLGVISAQSYTRNRYTEQDLDLLQLLAHQCGPALARIQAEASLAESQARLKIAQDAAGIGTWDLDLANAYATCSTQYFHLFGLDPGDHTISNERWLSLVHPEDRAQSAASTALLGQRLGPFELEYRVLHADGSTRWHLAKGEVHPGDDGRPGRVIGINLDITDRKELEQSIVEISEREQRRLGQDLHDDIGQTLTGMRFTCQLLYERLVAAKRDEAETAERMLQLLRHTITQIRGLINGLNAIDLKPEQFTQALRELARNIAQIYVHTGVSCTVESLNTVSIADAQTAAHLYRIAQEACNNAVKHGQAAHIKLSLNQENGHLHLAIRDDGTGIPLSENRPEGFGLRIMQQRARLIGAAFSIAPASDGPGTVVACRVPVPTLPLEA